MTEYGVGISVVIPTYNRGEVLLDTIAMLLSQDFRANEIVIVDQTTYQEGCSVLSKLRQWDQQGDINYICLDKPSIPMAMNTGLKTASSSHVLFLDDDIKIKHDFIKHHMHCIQRDRQVPAHVGQVLQPGESEIEFQLTRSKKGIFKDLEFKFNSNRASEINNCMAGNLCVNRLLAIKAGGFDCNFVGSAYRFETEFAKRLARSSDHSLMYYPEPSIRHLKAEKGGTRTEGHFLTTISSHHSFGDYYFALVEAKGWERLNYILRCWFRSIVARFYLRKPYYIPIRLIAETRGLFSALNLYRQGRKMIDDI